MSIALESEVNWLQSLSAADRARFFASLSHGLTVAVRVLCHSDADAKEALEAVRQLNEAHHRVAGYLTHIQGGSEDTAWLRAVTSYAITPELPAVRQQAHQAWQHARALIEGGSAA
ncbi:hypothetical protein [Rubrivivax sp. A210]|uniref:hypothetical protein n=1 Tax=Rubrivivax sp. A210 TaxID=2772301 RepID=UPI0019192F87|nr:hypothetical protein [Rubrivivax sp. A210]